MCRIAGFWDLNYKRNYDLREVATSMRDTLAHGGPDDAGIYIEPQIGLALTHRRLSILELSSLGHQPMEFDNLVITYNGEVYNFKEIRSELESCGYTFKSNSDTEVILKAFHKWGLSAVHKFRGMFAFAIWDRKSRKLFLCRDRVGVKPLYWYYKNGLFMFSSELKAFHKHPFFNKELSLPALSLYLQYGYITAPFSIFKNTYKLLSGHFLVVHESGKIEKIKYWDVKTYFLEGINEREKWLAKSEEELVEELESILVESFKLRLVSDVPVGMFLSGGVDSSTVCALLAKEGVKLKTFTIGFHEKEYNEAPHAKRIAEYLGTDHTELYCTPKEAFEIIFKLPKIYDEPFGDSSAIPTYLVSKLARSQVKVSLSADGGDEQFCGYSRYRLIRNRIRKLSAIPFLNLFSKTLDLLNPELAFKIYEIFRPFLPERTNFRDKFRKLRIALQNARDFKLQYDLSNKVFLEEDLKRLLRIFLDLVIVNQADLVESLMNDDQFLYMMFYDFRTYLPDDILVKVDRATMSVALEGREPFLDHKIVEWSSRLPVEFKFRQEESKYILKRLLYKYIPKELVERPKQGFGVPTYSWFKKDLKALYKEYLDEQRIKECGLFDHKEVSKLLYDFLNDKGVNHKKLWFLFIFELWRENWL